jgi:hypothetical protein
MRVAMEIRNAHLFAASRVYDGIAIHLGPTRYEIAIYQAAADFPFYLVDCPPIFDRQGLDGEAGVDVPDNHIRFAVFASAVIVPTTGSTIRPGPTLPRSPFRPTLRSPGAAASELCTSRRPFGQGGDVSHSPVSRERRRKHDRHCGHSGAVSRRGPMIENDRKSSCVRPGGASPNQNN